MTFELTDLSVLATLTFLEILLSADNAAILAVLTRPLEPKLRKKALFIGVLSAFILRGLALLGIAFLLQNRWIQLIGAAYLVYLSIHYFIPKRKINPEAPRSFWKTVFLIELFDLAFAIDSIVAGVAFISSLNTTVSGSNPKLWIVYTGGMLGLLTIRYAASILGSFIDRFPRLEASAHIMIGIIGLKLAFPVIAPFAWTAMALAFISGFYRKSKP